MRLVRGRPASSTAAAPDAALSVISCHSVLCGSCRLTGSPWNGRAGKQARDASRCCRQPPTDQIRPLGARAVSDQRPAQGAARRSAVRWALQTMRLSSSAEIGAPPLPRAGPSPPGPLRDRQRALLATVLCLLALHGSLQRGATQPACSAGDRRRSGPQPQHIPAAKRRASRRKPT